MTQKTNGGNADIIKRRATKIKKEMGIPHHQALEIAAKEFGYTNFKNLINNTERPEKRKRLSHQEVAVLPNPLVISYAMFGTPNGKRPNAKSSIDMHQKLGAVLKELHSASEFNKKAKTAISFVKSTLDDWVQLEYTDRKELSDELFFSMYYGDTDFPSDPWPTEKRKMELHQLVKRARAILKSAYHDCLPVQNINKKLDVVVKAIYNWPLNKQVKGLKEIKGKIPAGTLVYLKKHHKNPAIVLSHDTLNNLIWCYEDGGPTAMSREEITVSKNQSEAKNFQPMRLLLPYGKWTCENGTEVLFNRDYLPIWTRETNRKVNTIDPDTHINYIGEPEFYFGDGNAPWNGEKNTLVKCRNILNHWNVGHRKSKLVLALADSVQKGNARNLKFKDKTKIYP